jgi:hypothetical protein
MGSCIRRLPFHPKERLGPKSITWASEMAKHNSGVTETFFNMKADLDRERLVYERHWNQREKQIDRVLLNTAGMYGDLQGLIGPSMLAIPALEAGEEESETPAAEF